MTHLHQLSCVLDEVLHHRDDDASEEDVGVPRIGWLLELLRSTEWSLTRREHILLCCSLLVISCPRGSFFHCLVRVAAGLLRSEQVFEFPKLFKCAHLFPIRLNFLIKNPKPVFSIPRNRFLILRNLISSRHVRIKIVFSVEFRRFRDVTAHQNGHFEGVKYALTIQEWKDTWSGHVEWKDSVVRRSIGGGCAGE